MNEERGRKSRGERLLERQRILAASPYLAKEIEQSRTELGIEHAIIELGKHLAEASTWGSWGDANEEPITFDVYADLEIERVMEHILEEPTVAKAVASMARRYRFPRAGFFQDWLVWGQPPEPSAPSTWECERFIAIETDPPMPNPVEGSMYLARLFKWWPSKLKNREVKSIKIVIDPWTTLDDIKAAWRRVENLQRGLVSYDGERLRARQDLDRDIELHRLVHVEGHTIRDAIDFWNDRSPERFYDTDDARVVRSLHRLDEQMRPKP